MTPPLSQPRVTHEAKRPQTHCHIECNVRLETLENLLLFDYKVGTKYIPFRVPFVELDI